MNDPHDSAANERLREAALGPITCPDLRGLIKTQCCGVCHQHDGHLSAYPLPFPDDTIEKFCCNVRAGLVMSIEPFTG